jgi:hypothetical protein
MQQVYSEKSRLEWERLNEKIEVTAVSVDNNKLNATVMNVGALSSHLVNIWITKYNGNVTVWQKSYTINFHLNPGAIATNIGQNLEQIGDETFIYSASVVSERGNIATGVYLPIPPGQMKFGDLVFSFDYTSFNYTTTSDGSYYRDHSRPAYEMIGGKAAILFWVKVVNHGSNGIEINKLSYLEIIRPHSDTTEDEFYFFIVDRNSISGNAIAYQDYSQVIPCNPQDPEAGGSPTIIKFGATAPGVNTLQSMPSPYSGYTSERKYLFTSFIVIYWHWSGTTQYFGLVVPFAAIHVLSG